MSDTPSTLLGMSGSTGGYGIHWGDDDPIGAAREVGADHVQVFLGDPQDWKSAPEHPQAESLRAAPAEHGVGVYVHAPYVINVATSNNRIRIPSRSILGKQAKAAAAIGARGLIVHGGHVLDKDDPQVGFDNWRKVFERQADDGGFPVPILIENTAGGENAMARRLEALERLWEAVGEFGAGLCLDTCHAHAGGLELGTLVERVRGVTGRIDLVHLNDSRDAFDSGRDRHTGLGHGEAGLDALVEVVRAAGAPVVLETPADGHAAEIALLRERVG